MVFEGNIRASILALYNILGINKFIKISHTKKRGNIKTKKLKSIFLELKIFSNLFF